MIAAVAEMTVRVAARHVSVGIGRFGISRSLAVVMSVTVGIRIAGVSIAIMRLSISRPFAVVVTVMMGIRITVTMTIVTIMRLCGCGGLSISSGFRLSCGSRLSISL